MRILIVEDDAALSSFLRKGLEAEHHAVDVANEGNQGRAMAMEVDYDLVVLDLNLPGVDGLSVLKKFAAAQGELAGDDSHRRAAGSKTACSAWIRARTITW